MRVIIIILVCVGLVGFGIFKISNVFATKGGKHPEKSLAGSLLHTGSPQPAAEAPAPVSEAAPVQAAPVLSPVPFGPPLPDDYVPPPPKAQAVAEQEAKPLAEAGSNLMGKKPVEIRVFSFVNRIVPSIDVLRAEVAAAADFSVLVDQRANAWILRAPADVMEEYSKVVQALDVRPDQVDMDFLLVAVSQDRVASLGLSGLLNSGAPHLEGVSLVFEPSGLNLRVGSSSLNLEIDKGREAVHVVTLPVVRAVAGEPFKLDSVDEIPIAQSTYRDDVETRSYEYRKVGLGISGGIVRVGASMVLSLKQSNGSVVRESAEAPTFRTSTTETVAWLQPGEWTVVSGLTMERRVWRRGFLERKDDQEKDLVLLFARARTSVGSSQVGEFVEIDDMRALDGGDHPLLPARPTEASDSKEAVERMETEWLRERSQRASRSRIGPRHRN
ncbi:hypothetical protein [Luteolibacter luteus]|uniref:Uncharacterized protein n=1 Tax=Luteolibacter luteus TaxID=2728835 RepID=A0A858RSG2_9BACT|nr:hypothetical protein [Luteolibacter luteus]QJE98883.1 hypothetical protein HHL09_24915 [Luteolibacter luteus]